MALPGLPGLTMALPGSRLQLRAEDAGVLGPCGERGTHRGGDCPTPVSRVPCGHWKGLVERSWKDVPKKKLIFLASLRWWNFTYVLGVHPDFGRNDPIFRLNFFANWVETNTYSSCVRLLEGKASYFYWEGSGRGGRSFAKNPHPFWLE